MKKSVVKTVISYAAAMMITSSFISTSLPKTAAEDITSTFQTLIENDNINVITNNHSEKSSELLYKYMLTQAGIIPGTDISKNGKAVLYSAGITAGEKLTGNDALVYDYMKTEIQAIAAGRRSSTKIEIPVSVFGIKEGPWSASELGVDSIISDGKITDDSVEILREKISCDFDKIMTALLADCPYDMYWCDKTSYLYYLGGSVRAKHVNGEYCLYLTSCPSITLYVSADYATDHAEETDFLPDNRLSAVTEAINNAQAIVEKNRDKHGKELLDAYRKAICDAVEYNYDTSEVYGDPWQLIYVFDGDDTTNVVCEGYAKAFKYLCDISADRLENISCLIATGTSTAPHMWNIVNMDDDCSYLVDITQCDGTGREIKELTDTFFLGIPTSGSYSTKYRFTFPGAKFKENGYIYSYPSRTYDYTYDSDTKSIYKPAYLTLSSEPYTEKDLSGQTSEVNKDHSVSVSIPDKTYDGDAVSPDLYIYKTKDTNKTPVSVPGADIYFTYYEYDGTSSITDNYVNSLTALDGAPKNAGMYIVRASASADGYEFEDVYSVFTIKQRTINVAPSPSGKTFGDDGPDFTDILYDKKEIISGDVVNISGAYSLDNYNGNVGIYSVSSGTLETDNNNYALSVSGKFTVEAKPLTDDNITILKKAVADNNGIAFPADSVSVTAVINGETVTLIPAVYDAAGNYIKGDYRIISPEQTNNIGDFTFMIEGVGNYTGHAEAVVEVVGGDCYVTVKNGTLKDGSTEKYFKANTVATATADEAEEGYKFGYWKKNGVTISYNPTYTFYATSDEVNLEAVYIEDTDDIEKYGNAKIESVTSDKTNGKLQFVSILNVPDDCKILKAGIVATSDSEKATDLTAENADFVRADATDKHNYKYTWTKSKVTDDQTWYVKGYLVYEDAKGNQKTVYSDLTKATLEGSETIIEDKIVGTAVIDSVTPLPDEKKLQFVAMLNVPADCTINKAGIVATSDTDKAANLTAENADFVRADATTKHGYKYTWTKTKVTSDQTWYVRPYLVYTDANGKVFTVYGELTSGKIN